MLGDELYSNQPLWQLVLAQTCHFVFVCKPAAHQILSEWLASLAASDALDQITLRRFTEIITCRFVEAVPLRGAEAALLVNCGEVTITHSKSGEQLYYNTFVTNLPLTTQTLFPLVEAGRAPWKVENKTTTPSKPKAIIWNPTSVTVNNL